MIMTGDYSLVIISSPLSFALVRRGKTSLENEFEQTYGGMIPYSTVQPEGAGKVFFILCTLTEFRSLVLTIGIFVSLESVIGVSLNK